MKQSFVVVIGLVTCSLSGMIGCGAPLEDDDSTPGAVEFSSLYSAYLDDCAVCHAPDAPGKTSSTEQSLDFSSESSAQSSILGGVATGLVGNQAGCNGVPFVGSSADNSLILAVLDQDVRASFSLSSFPDCDADAISDMTVKMGYNPDEAFLDDLRSWIDSNAGTVARH